MKRFRRLLILILPLAVLLAVGLAATWVLRSENGSRWLFGRLSGMLPGELSAQGIEGNLTGELRLSGLHYRDAGISAAAEELRLSVNLDFLPPLLRLDSLHGREIDLQLLESGDSSPTGPIELPDLSLPVAVELADIHIDQARLRDPGGDILLELQQLAASARLNHSLVIDHLEFESAGQLAEISGNLGLSPPYHLSIDARTSGASTLRLGASGELENLQLELSSRQPDIEVRGVVRQLLADPRWDLTLESPELKWPPGSTEDGWSLSRLVLHTTGGPGEYQLQLEGEAAVRGIPPTRVELTGNGNLQALEIEKLELRGPTLDLTALGTAGWAPQPSVQLEARLQRLDPRAWIADWPEGLPVRGQANLDWQDSRVELASLELALDGRPTVLRGDGVVDLQTGVVDGRLNWNDLSWPPGSDQPAVRSDTGDFTVAGTPDDWRLSGSMSVVGADLPPGELAISGQGDRRSTRVVLHEAAILGGRIEGQGSFDWTGAMPFSAELQVDHVQTGALLPEFPGHLTTHVDLTGQASPLRIEADLNSLEGTVRDIVLTGQGGISWAPDLGRYRARQLELRSGPAFLRLDGEVHEQAGLAFELNVDSLGRFVSDSSGSLRGDGRVSIYGDHPVLAVTLEGSRLAAAGVEIEQLAVKPIAGAGTELELFGLRFGDQLLDSLSLKMPGSTPLQRLELSADYGATRLHAKLNGGLSDWSDPSHADWKGSLEQLQIDHEGQFELQLDEPAQLNLGAGNFDLGGACLSGSRDTRLCLDGHWRGGRETALAARLVSVPLSLIEPFVDADIEFTQILNGHLEWNRTAGRKASGAAEIDLSPGDVLFQDDPDPILRTGPGQISYQLVNGNLQEGMLNLQLPGSGQLAVDFNIPNVANGPDSPVRGRARVELHDLSVLNRLQSVFDEIRGELDVDLSLAGTLADPVFEGTASLGSAHLENRASGLEFSEVNLSGQITPDDRSLLSGHFRSGDGEGQLKLDVQFEDMMSPTLRLGLRGESLTIVDVPELRVVADPDISLSWENQLLEIDGRLAIPSARLTPAYLPQASVMESPDVVVVAGELPHQTAQQGNDKPVRLRGELEVELGQDVVVEFDLARAHVTGQTVFRWQNSRVPIASGNFDLNGEILAYGQQLNITQGRISFPEIPADNPHLNIRAEREIYGNTQIRRAGLMVAGTARRPVIEAYTVPMTDKDRARTLLVTGSDFNYEQGVGAVGVGTYVLPRLYLSYGIGIFEDGNTISARYDLGRGFGVKATSGERETGVDLNYRIEH